MEKQPKTGNGGENLADEKEKIRAALEEAYDNDPEGVYDALSQAGFDDVHIDDLSDEQRAIVLGKIRGSGDSQKKNDSETVVRTSEVHTEDIEKKRKQEKKVGNKAVVVALVAAIAATSTFAGFVVGGRFGFGKKDKNGTGPSGTPGITPTPTPVVALEEGQGTGDDQGEQATGGDQGEQATGGDQGAEEGEQNESYHFTDKQEYYYESVKLTDGTRMEGAFARSERVNGEALFNMSEEEQKLILDGNEEAEGYEAAVDKLVVESIMLVSEDSRGAAASYVCDIEQVAPGTFAEFGIDSSMSPEEVEKRLYDMDDEAAAKCLTKLHDTLGSAKTRETTIQGYYANFYEKDNKDEKGYHHADLAPMLSCYKDPMPVTEITLPNGGVIYSRMLVRNMSIEDKDGKPTVICYDKDGNIYYGCTQPLLPVGNPEDGPTEPDPEYPPNPPQGEVKNADAAVARAGENNEQESVSGAPEVSYDSSSDDYVVVPAGDGEGSTYEVGVSEENDQIIDNSDKKANDDVHEPTASTPSVTPDDKDKEQKADDQADADSQKAKELENITDEEASAMFGF